MHRQRALWLCIAIALSIASNAFASSPAVQAPAPNGLAPVPALAEAQPSGANIAVPPTLIDDLAWHAAEAARLARRYAPDVAESLEQLEAEANRLQGEYGRFGAVAARAATARLLEQARAVRERLSPDGPAVLKDEVDATIRDLQSMETGKPPAALAGTTGSAPPPRPQTGSNANEALLAQELDMAAARAAQLAVHSGFDQAWSQMLRFEEQAHELGSRFRQMNGEQRASLLDELASQGERIQRDLETRKAPDYVVDRWRQVIAMVGRLRGVER